MLDRLSVPRRPFDFEDYIDILRRNVRWIIAPAFAGLVISTVTAYLMEDTYVSQALIRIVPQQISPELVQNVTSQEVADHINSMAQGILSRNTLTGIINQHGLYKKEIKSEPLEDVLNEMRTHAIGIHASTGVAMSGKSMPAMQVSFAYNNPYIAKDVCQDIVGRFMNENSQTTLESQEQTQQFLNDEFERAKRDLDAIEQKLTDYREKNAGRLPEEMQTNMTQMNALEGRLSSLTEAASRNNEQRMLIESELHIAKDRLAAIRSGGSPQVQARNEKIATLDHQIETVENNITSLKDHYTDDYPDVQAARDQLALLKRQREEAAKEKPAKPDAPVDNPGVTRERLDAQGAVEQLQAQLRANASELQQLNGQIGSVNAALRNYQSRIESAPVGESAYADLLRDRDLAKQRYDDMQTKREKSSVSMDLERNKQGETLEVLDAASLPSQPTAPKRAMIIPIGAVVGLLVGIILVAVRELKDTSLKNLKDARLYTQLSILGSIPLLENDLVVQRRKQIMWVGWATATVTGLAIMAGSVAHYYMNKAQQ
ncbi:MAG: GNVR domain-containing protein [Bryobacteraceae bacterium]